MAHRVVVRCPALLLAQIDNLAARTGRPRSHVVRLLLARATEADLPGGWIDAADAQLIAIGATPRRSTSTG